MLEFIIDTFFISIEQGKLTVVVKAIPMKVPKTSLPSFILITKSQLSYLRLPCPPPILRVILAYISPASWYATDATDPIATATAQPRKLFLNSLTLYLYQLIKWLKDGLLLLE